MQALVQHLAAKQIHEHADAAEENRQSHVVQLKDACEQTRGLGDVHRFSFVDELELAVDELQADIHLSIGIPVKVALDEAPVARWSYAETNRAPVIRLAERLNDLLLTGADLKILQRRCGYGMLRGHPGQSRLFASRIHGIAEKQYDGGEGQQV